MHYAEQKIFGPYDDGAAPMSLKIFPGGGNVTLETQVSETKWSLHDTYTDGTARMIEVAGCTLRITPTGGAEYNFGEGM